MTRYLLIALLVLTWFGETQSQGFANATTVEDIDDRRTITSIAIDHDNNKYIGTDQGLLKISSTGVVEMLLSQRSVHALAWSKREGLWAAVDGNIVINPESGVRISLGDDEDLQIQSMDLSGAQLWVGTNVGLYTVSVRKQKVTEHYTPENSKLLSSNIRYVYVDGSQIKWIGTDRGVARVVNKKWKLYEKNERIMAITSNIEGVWIASDREMWLVDSYNRWVPTDVRDGLSEGDVRALASDKKGRLYILSDVLIQFDPYSDEAIELENEYAVDQNVQVAILCDLDDNLWMGSLEHGLVTLDMQVSENEELEAFVTVRHPRCFGENTGGITINARGGAPPYSYMWGNTDTQGRSPQNLYEGRYTLTVTDAQGAEYSHDITLEAPQPLDISINVIQEISEQGASDGILQVAASGGTGDYIYLWDNSSSSRTLNNATPGLHSVELKDREGCIARAEYMMADGPLIVEESIPDLEIKPSKPVQPVESVDIEGLKELDASTLVLGQTLRIEQLFFDADSSTIKTTSNAVLDEVYEFLHVNEEIVIEIGGHTNGLPEHEYCDRLSKARAKKVAEYLYRKGIRTDRITFKGYGKRQPIATNETVVGRRQNQRVEIKILQI